MDIEHGIELVRRHLFVHLVPPHAGIVDDRVDRAECLERLADDRLAALRGCHRVVAGNGRAPRSDDFAHHRLGGRTFRAVQPEQIVDHNRGPAATKL